MNDDYKEACRLFWLTKGHLYNVSDEKILSCHDSYFKRLWGNNERAVYGWMASKKHIKKDLTRNRNQYINISVNVEAT